MRAQAMCFNMALGEDLVVEGDRASISAMQVLTETEEIGKEIVMERYDSHLPCLMAQTVCKAMGKKYKVFVTWGTLGRDFLMNQRRSCTWRGG